MLSARPALCYRRRLMEAITQMLERTFSDVVVHRLFCSLAPGSVTGSPVRWESLVLTGANPSVTNLRAGL